MFIPWWGIALISLVLIYLIVMVRHLHNRVRRLEKILRRLEGISEDDLKKEIREKMLENDEGGKA
jgi:hypothetical protein